MCVCCPACTILQWRIVHEAIATYKHVAHLDPSTGVGCPFGVESLSVDPVLMLKGLLAGRLRVEFAYYRLTGNLDGFLCTWGLGGLLCFVEDEMLCFSF